MTMEISRIPEEAGVPPAPDVEAATVIGGRSRLAEGLRHAANAFSLSRVVGGIALGYQIGSSEYPSDSLAELIAVGGLGATDYIDGRLARAATAIDGKRSRLGSWLDQMADKVFVTAVLGGVACGSFVNNRPETGVVTAAAWGVFMARDAYVTWRRTVAEQANLGIDTGAKWHGKAKTALQFGALTALVSPAVESQPGTWGALTMLTASVVLSIYSGLKYHVSFGNAMRASQPAK